MSRQGAAGTGGGRTISVKLLLPMCLMIGLSVGIGGYGLWQMARIKATYQGVVELSERAKAAFAVSGALHGLHIFARDIVTETEPENLRAMAGDVEGFRRRFSEGVAELRRLFPGQSESVDSAGVEFDAMMRIVTGALESAVAGNREQAADAILSRFDAGPLIRQFDAVAGHVKAAVAQADAAAAARFDGTVRTTLTAGGLGAGGVLALALWLTAWHVTRPLRRMVGQMSDLAAGRLETAVDDAGRRDEIGAALRALGVFRQAMRDAQAAETARDHLRRQAETEKQQALNDLSEVFQARLLMVAQAVNDGAERMRETASQLSDLAEAAGRRSSAVADSAGAASENVDTVATAVRALSSSIRDIGERAVRSTDVAHSAVAAARRSESAVGELLVTAHKIGGIARLIAEIASRTNLLALNATIEAARAGDAGRGFAIVAQEVKALARQTAEATEAVQSQIDGMQKAVTTVGDTMRGVGEATGELESVIVAIAAAVAEQEAVTAEIARSALLAAEGTGNVKMIIGAVSSAANETGSKAGAMLTAAGVLAGDAAHLREEVANFTFRIRGG